MGPARASASLCVFIDVCVCKQMSIHSNTWMRMSVVWEEKKIVETKKTTDSSSCVSVCPPVHMCEIII